MVEVPDDFAQALRDDADAWASFVALSENDQRHLVELVLKARDDDHRRRRIVWIVEAMSGPFLLWVGAAVLTTAL